MVDPLSILGAAVGVTSLIVQTVDECIKAYQYYAKAVGMPEEYRYCKIRLQMEQQRFLNFCLEAGILYTDGTLCETLQINNSLLLAVLAEIKTLFADYATKEGKYEETQGETRSSEQEEPETGLVTLIFQPLDDSSSASFAPDEEKHQRFKKLRKAKKGIVQTGKNIRTIALEPKRLVWASVDKSSFEDVIAKLGALNSFLTSLLNSSRAEKLQLTMDTSYNEILQIRDDIKGLSRLIEALSNANNEKDYSLGGTLLHGSHFQQPLLREMEAQRKKQINDQGLPESNISATYDDRDVWIEWSSYHSDQPHTESSNSRFEDRIRLLADLLCDEIPAAFRLPPCLGYLAYHHEDQTWFGIVFEKPPRLLNRAIPQVTTLRQLLQQKPVPSLSTRISLCATLAECVHTFHAVDWVHKGLRSEKIVFFSQQSSNIDLQEPFVLGYELSRPTILDELSEKPTFNPREDIYRHPFAQSSQNSGEYRKCYDIYSLGILLIEIATWKPIHEFLDFDDLDSAKPSQLIAVQKRLLEEDVSDNYLQRIASNLGDSYKEIVELCLRADEVERPVYGGESRTSMAVRLQRTLELNIVRKLGDMKRAMVSSDPL